jgi:hypothetical protein
VAKFVCPACRKILIRSANEIRFSNCESYCETAGKVMILKRLKIKSRRKSAG